MSYEKIVICDLDGTLVEESEAIKEASKELLGKELSRQEVRKLDKKLKAKIYDLAQSKIEKYIPKKKTIEIVNKLKEEGFFVVIMTARFDRVKKETEELLKRIGVKYDLLLIRNSEEMKIDDEVWKAQKLKEFFGKENVYLEDKPENILFMINTFKELAKNGEKGKFYLIVDEYPFLYELH
jgi:hydroxymethylpyrimidine pyrophosphatase-like HAD family hydrolase